MKFARRTIYITVRMHKNLLLTEWDQLINLQTKCTSSWANWLTMASLSFNWTRNLTVSWSTSYHNDDRMTISERWCMTGKMAPSSDRNRGSEWMLLKERPDIRWWGLFVLIATHINSLDSDIYWMPWVVEQRIGDVSCSAQARRSPSQVSTHRHAR